MVSRCGICEPGHVSVKTLQADPDPRSGIATVESLSDRGRSGAAPHRARDPELHGYPVLRPAQPRELDHQHPPLRAGRSRVSRRSVSAIRLQFGRHLRRRRPRLRRVEPVSGDPRHRTWPWHSAIRSTFTASRRRAASRGSRLRTASADSDTRPILAARCPSEKGPARSSHRAVRTPNTAPPQQATPPGRPPPFLQARLDGRRSEGSDPANPRPPTTRAPEPPGAPGPTSPRPPSTVPRRPHAAARHPPGTVRAPAPQPPRRSHPRTARPAARTHPAQRTTHGEPRPAPAHTQASRPVATHPDSPPAATATTPGQPPTQASARPTNPQAIAGRSQELRADQPRIACGY